MPASIEIAQRIAVPTRYNPRTNRDYIILLRKVCPFSFHADGVYNDLTIQIRYVPDRLICDTKQIEVYFNLLASQPITGLEELANAIADDFGNELIPRWISVDLSISVLGILHSTHVEDKQPLWDNSALLQRLA